MGSRFIGGTVKVCKAVHIVLFSGKDQVIVIVQ